MMNIETIERYVDDALENYGIVRGEREQLRKLLFHFYTATSIFRLMTDEEKEQVVILQRELSVIFATKNHLKERKRKERKRKNPLNNPLIKEKETKEKDEKNTYNAKRDFSAALDERKMAFLLDCERHIERYEKQTIDDFFNYWSEENKREGKMLFEYEKTWNTAKRLYSWANNSITCTKKAAQYRLERTKQGRTPKPSAAEQAVAKEREEQNAQREAAHEENRRKAITPDEYVKLNPESTLAKMLKNSETQ